MNLVDPRGELSNSILVGTVSAKEPFHNAPSPATTIIQGRLRDPDDELVSYECQGVVSNILLLVSARPGSSSISMQGVPVEQGEGARRDDLLHRDIFGLAVSLEFAVK